MPRPDARLSENIMPWQTQTNGGKMKPPKRKTPCTSQDAAACGQRTTSTWARPAPERRACTRRLTRGAAVAGPSQTAARQGTCDHTHNQEPPLFFLQRPPHICFAQIPVLSGPPVHHQCREEPVRTLHESRKKKNEHLGPELKTFGSQRPLFQTNFQITHHSR